MKFKVGDKVVFSKYGGDCWEKDYGVSVGDIVVISSVGRKDYWFTSKTGKCVCTTEDKLTTYFAKVDNVEQESKAIESDGGSSDYYFTKLPLHVIDQIILTGGIEIKDIARYVYDNDADAFNIIKAEKRIIEAKKGKGKAGIDMLYDMNKVKFFANERYEAIKQGSEE